MSLRAPNAALDKRARHAARGDISGWQYISWARSSQAPAMRLSHCISAAARAAPTLRHPLFSIERLHCASLARHCLFGVAPLLAAA